MKVFPMLTLVFSFWQLGNRQIFDNKTVPMSKNTHIKLSGHTFGQTINDMTFISPQFFPFIAIVAGAIFLAITYIKVILKMNKDKDTLAVEEDLVPYYEALT